MGPVRRRAALGHPQRAITQIPGHDTYTLNSELTPIITTNESWSLCLTVCLCLLIQIVGVWTVGPPATFNQRMSDCMSSHCVTRLQRATQSLSRPCGRGVCRVHFHNFNPSVPRGPPHPPPLKHMCSTHSVGVPW